MSIDQLTNALEVQSEEPAEHSWLWYKHSELGVLGDLHERQCLDLLGRLPVHPTLTSGLPSIQPGYDHV